MQMLSPLLDWKGQPLPVRLNNLLQIVVVHSTQCVASLEAVHKAAQDKGWLGVGYHYWIDTDGKVKAARPHVAVGAHALGYNGVSVGVALAGDCRVMPPSDAQFDALQDVMRLLTQDADGIQWALHRDICDTDCPGLEFPEGLFVTKMAAIRLARYRSPKPQTDRAEACAMAKHEQG